MINYKDYEKQVYDWLMTNHNEDVNFTFSLRQKGSKGADKEYFIDNESFRNKAVYPNKTSFLL
jgi:5-methylcytosine-specific restriction protein B